MRRGESLHGWQLAIRNVLQAKLATALYCSHNCLLLLLAVIDALALLFSAHVCLINFDNAAERLRYRIAH
jgi:hypothetical protein